MLSALPFAQFRRTARELGAFLYTIFLFTYSDMKTILIPTTLFGTVAAPPATFSQILPRTFWVWYNLLQVDVNNQSRNPDEDRMNKPWRPIPSRRISVASARTFRWILLPTGLAVSMLCKVPMAGIALTIANFCYHELGFAEHWLTKNFTNAWGYACFNAGATRILCDPSLEISRTSMYAQALNALVIATTIHSQDFQDVEGDRASGRETFPSAFPTASRVSVLVLLPVWSVFLASFWRASLLFSTIFIAVGTAVGLMFFLNRTSASTSNDRTTYRVYNVWLCLVHVIPFLS